MKIIVVSDSHGKNSRLDEILQLQPDADMYLHCGDIETYEEEYPMYKTVMGNNDYFYSYPERLSVEAGGMKILVIHGNQFPYMRRIERMFQHARENGFDIICYGHTHVADIQVEDGIMLLNPGSLWRSRDGRGPSYAILTIEDGKARAEIKYLL